MFIKCEVSRKSVTSLIGAHVFEKLLVDICSIESFRGNMLFYNDLYLYPRNNILKFRLVTAV